MKFQLFNVRLGLATNSSSSHSMIRLNEQTAKGQKAVDRLGGFRFSDEQFTLRSYPAKMMYLAMTLWENRLRLWPKDSVTLKTADHDYDFKLRERVVPPDWAVNRARQIAREILVLCELDASDDALDAFLDGYISDSGGPLIPQIPLNHRQEGPNLVFLAHLKEYLRDDHLAIIGGRDGDHYLASNEHGAEVSSFEVSLDTMKVKEELDTFPEDDW